MRTMKISQRKIVDVIGFPMDLGADRRGVDMGPSALRIAGIESKLRNLGYEVIDQGDISIEIQERQKAGNPKLKYLTEIIKTSEILAEKVERSLRLNHFPLCLGGDHSIALGTIAGISAYCRNRGFQVGVIWIDAHADMNTEKTSPSGNIHGMPLAASLGMGNRRLTNLLGFSPKIKSENCALIGIRSIDPQERENIRKKNLEIYTMTDIDRKGVHYIINKILRKLRGKVDHIHVSFDLDSVDPLTAGGVGTPVAGGLSFREAHLLMETIAECGCMSSLEVAEVNPILDNKNQSAVFAADIVASSMGMRIL